MGKEKYKEKISGMGDSDQNGLIVKIKKWLLKRGLRDPLSGSDMKNLLFFIGPLFRILDVILMIVIPIYLIKVIIWFIYYKRELSHLDSS
jgi:hypothetical protein